MTNFNKLLIIIIIIIILKVICNTISTHNLNNNLIFTKQCHLEKNNQFLLKQMKEIKAHKNLKIFLETLN